MTKIDKVTRVAHNEGRQTHRLLPATNSVYVSDDEDEEGDEGHFHPTNQALNEHKDYGYASSSKPSTVLYKGSSSPFEDHYATLHRFEETRGTLHRSRKPHKGSVKHWRISKLNKIEAQ